MGRVSRLPVNDAGAVAASPQLPTHRALEKPRNCLILPKRGFLLLLLKLCKLHFMLLGWVLRLEQRKDGHIHDVPRVWLQIHSQRFAVKENAEYCKPCTRVCKCGYIPHLWNDFYYRFKVRSVWQAHKTHQKITTNKKSPHHRKRQPKNRGSLVLFLWLKGWSSWSHLCYPCKLWSGTTELWKCANCERFFKLLTYYYCMFHAEVEITVYTPGKLFPGKQKYSRKNFTPNISCYAEITI